jgi:hypothetical protein
MPILHPRGTKWLVYDLSRPQTSGFIGDFHNGKNTIETIWRKAYENGQRVLGLPFPVWHGVSNGLTMNPWGGHLDPQTEENFINVLMMAHTIGFERIDLEFIWMGPNDPTHNWVAFDEPVSPLNPDGSPRYAGWEQFKDCMYLENWLLVGYVRKVLQSYWNKPYLLDISPEWNAAIPVLDEFSRRIWIDYTSNFGDPADGNHVDSATMSMVPDEHLSHYSDGAELDVFSGNLPYVLDWHIYGPGRWGSAYTAFLRMNWMFSQNGRTVVIGETYPDTITAKELCRASDDSGQPIHHACQWQETPDSVNDTANVIPTSISRYLLP